MRLRSTAPADARRRRRPGWSLTQVSVRTKVLASTATGLLALLLVGAAGIVGMAQVNGTAQELHLNAARALPALGTIRDMIGDNRVSVYAMLRAGDASERSAIAEEVATTDRTLDEALTEYVTAHQGDLGADRTAFVVNFRFRYAEWRRIRDDIVFPALDRGDVEAAAAAVDGPLAAANEAFATHMDALNLAEAEWGVATAKEATEVYEWARLAVVVAIVLGAALAIAVGLVVARRLVTSVTRVLGVLSGLAEGDLTGSTGVTSRDEVGRMAAALDLAMGNLRQIIGSLSSSADVLAESAEELLATNRQIAGSAADTAAQSAVVSSAAEQINVNVHSVAGGAGEMGSSIREIAETAAEAAHVAGGAVLSAEAANATVRRLGQSSSEIGAVVKAISAIAQQTNLLALNATIEAARVGRGGQGVRRRRQRGQGAAPRRRRAPPRRSPAASS